jgi:hypothetical protein
MPIILPTEPPMPNIPSKPPNTPSSPLPVETYKNSNAIWVEEPVLQPTNPFIAAYGNTIFAYTQKLEGNYQYHGGLHGGLDFGGSRGDTVIAALKDEGKVEKITNATLSTEGKWTVDSEWSVQIFIKRQNGSYPNGIQELVYQHFKEIDNNVRVGMIISPSSEGTVLGKVGLGEPLDKESPPAGMTDLSRETAPHLHLELRSNNYVHNPLLYFEQSKHDFIVKQRIDGKGNIQGETFYQQCDINNRAIIPWDHELNQPIIPVDYFNSNNGYLLDVLFPQTNSNFAYDNLGTYKISGSNCVRNARF